METFLNAEGKSILERMIRVIQENKARLSEIDGLIGDGDHGVNMNKGFTMFGERISGKETGFTGGLDELGTLLFTEIGGSMGPIYGTVFTAMAEAGESCEQINAQAFGGMLRAGLEGLLEVVDARPGDKTLVDTLDPAVRSFQEAVSGGTEFSDALERMKQAAVRGRDSTKDMTARFGRSSRLGERSRGVLDAGAASCCLLLEAMADGILELLGKGE